jgi:erythromycin esterase-like protein
MQLIGDAQFVLLGESTHGTHEFYRERTRITQRLVKEKGFTAVAIEGNWPDAERVDRYIRGASSDTRPEQALANFTDFPRWMWGNAEVRDFVQWLRTYNEALPQPKQHIGFYGMDLYSLARSTDAVVAALKHVDIQAAQRARQRYQCFAPFQADPIDYGRAAAKGDVLCQDAASQQLEDIQQLMRRHMTTLATADTSELFSALHNARVVKSAEAYYRMLFTGGSSTWNLRDEHMTDTVDALGTQNDARARPRKVVVWAHNTHTGDASATELGENGEWSLGQLMRERHGDNVVLIGFTTHSGTVIAASAWDKPGEIKDVRPALPESYAGHFHDLGFGNALLPLRDRGDVAAGLNEPRLQRAIGVVYLPQTERQSHYFTARLSQQFDAVIHWDVTRAIEPLEQ